MSASTAALARVGQSLWLDNITRGLLDDGGERVRVGHVTGDPPSADALGGGTQDLAAAGGQHHVVARGDELATGLQADAAAAAGDDRYPSLVHQEGP